MKKDEVEIFSEDLSHVIAFRDNGKLEVECGSGINHYDQEETKKLYDTMKSYYEKVEKLHIFLDALTDSLGNSEGLTLDEVRAELREDGIDVDAAEKRIANFVKKLSKKAKGEKHVPR